jgi:hypothetical protein
MENNKMKTKQRIILSLILSLLISLPVGCTLTKEPGKLSIQPVSARQPETNVKQVSSDAVGNRFREPASQGQTPVESAIELSRKYARLSEEAAFMQQQNKDLIAKNRLFRDQNTALKAQLQQTQKELTEANELMIEMRIELNNWQNNVLGFRDEIRDAESAQLQALLSILKILGGDIKAETVQYEKVSSADVTSGETGRSEL